MRRALRILFLFVPFYLLSQETIVKELCEKREEMSDFLKSYKVFAEVENFVYDQNGSLLRDERREIELYWDGNRWREKGGKEISGMGKSKINPFKSSDVPFFQYEVKDLGDKWYIVAKLCEKQRDLEAEEGNYIVSKNIMYFEKTFTKLSKLPSDLKNFELETDYGEIERGVFAPKKNENRG